MNRIVGNNVIRQEYSVGREEREAIHAHRGVTVWFTGLSASGKSTVANLVDQELTRRRISCYVLDGDNIRHGLNRDLGFGPEDRNENIRRIGEVARLFTEAGIVNMAAFISPYRADRDRNRALQNMGDFIEVYVESPLDVCERRDPKGLYRKARAGTISEFTGISAPYEPPWQPELVLRTHMEDPEESANRVVEYLAKHGYLAVE